MRFTDAFNILLDAKAAKRVFVPCMRLPQWQPDVKIFIQWPDENSKMTHPYLYVESRYGMVPWKETMVELFSDDWEVVHEL